jgi:hypothetical protein
MKKTEQEPNDDSVECQAQPPLPAPSVAATWGDVARLLENYSKPDRDRVLRALVVFFDVDKVIVIEGRARQQ